MENLASKHISVDRCSSSATFNTQISSGFLWISKSLESSENKDAFYSICRMMSEENLLVKLYRSKGLCSPKKIQAPLSHTTDDH